jgi:hypothetical protein
MQRRRTAVGGQGKRPSLCSSPERGPRPGRQKIAAKIPAERNERDGDRPIPGVGKPDRAIRRLADAFPEIRARAPLVRLPRRCRAILERAACHRVFSRNVGNALGPVCEPDHMGQTRRMVSERCPSPRGSVPLPGEVVPKLKPRFGGVFFYRYLLVGMKPSPLRSLVPRITDKQI